MITTSKIKDLLPIQSQFETGEFQDSFAFQGIIDENMFNHIFLGLSENKERMSLRKVLSADQRGQMILAVMTTSTLGLLLPAVKEEFGEGKKVDLVGTLS